MNLKEKLKLAESILSLVAVAELLGRPICSRPGTCRSPFRDERKPSWSWWFASDGRARWKDFGNNDGGDVARFIAVALGLSNKEAISRYFELAGLSENVIKSLPPLKPVVPKSIPVKETNEKQKLPDDLHPGTCAEIGELLRLRSWDVSIDYLHKVSSDRFLRFGTWQGHRAWFLVDPAERFFEARRMDGKIWSSNGAKSDSRGSKSLLGAEHLRPGSIALLVEEAPDFLACHLYLFQA
jgi:hypothetical protein